MSLINKALQQIQQIESSQRNKGSTISAKEVRQNQNRRYFAWGMALLFCFLLGESILFIRTGMRLHAKRQQWRIAQEMGSVAAVQAETENFNSAIFENVEPMPTGPVASDFLASEATVVPEIATNFIEEDGVEVILAEQTQRAKIEKSIDLTSDEEEAIQNFITNLAIKGITVDGENTKLLLSEGIYKLNNMISPFLKLCFSGIENDTLVFTDQKGKKYNKSFL